MKPFKPFLELFENIIAGTRAALFMRVHLWSFKSNYAQICLLLIVSLSLSLVYDYFDTAPDNYFNPYGLSYQALLYLSFFFSLSLIAVINNRQNDLGKLIILLLSIVPVIWLGSICLLALSSQQTYFNPYQSNWIVFIIYSVWYLIVVARLFKRFLYQRVLPTLLYVAIYALINFLPLFVLPTEPLWYPLPEEYKNTSVDSTIDVESVYYSQPSLLKQTVNRLHEGKNGVVDLFFIGFAGVAGEDVFMNEAKSAQTILDDRFNTMGRSMILVNNLKTVSNTPLANSHNLKNGIAEIATLMNRDEDILVLFLTSHGTKDHNLSANFPPFKLNSIDAEIINSALNSAEIKWRIIIISACYSGGFIEPLSSPYSLIITASNSEQNSFGCGHNGQYTYFGDAYLEKGLKQTQSFIQAFDVAKDIILEKENKKGFENSDPQIMIGSEIESKLIEYEKSLEAKRRNNWAVTASH